MRFGESHFRKTPKHGGRFRDFVVSKYYLIKIHARDCWHLKREGVDREGPNNRDRGELFVADSTIPIS